MPIGSLAPNRNAWQSPPTQPILHAVKRLVPLLGAATFAANVATAAVPISELRAMAEAGNLEAHTELAKAYFNGDGVQKDEQEAIKWLRMAALQGNARAQSNLGACYETGRGVPVDPDESLHWYRKAAEQGWRDAQYNLARFYAWGIVVPKDDSEAVKWYSKAANQGDPDAQYSLGVHYAKGQGVSKDEVEAYAFFNLAAAKSYMARDGREALEKILSREEIAAGQRRTRELQKEMEARRSASAPPR